MACSSNQKISYDSSVHGPHVSLTWYVVEILITRRGVCRRINSCDNTDDIAVSLLLSCGTWKVIKNNRPQLYINSLILENNKSFSLLYFRKSLKLKSIFGHGYLYTYFVESRCTVHELKIACLFVITETTINKKRWVLDETMINITNFFTFVLLINLYNIIRVRYIATNVQHLLITIN